MNIPPATVKHALNIRRSYIRACNADQSATTPRIVRRVAEQHNVTIEHVFACLTIASRVKVARQREREEQQRHADTARMMRQNGGTL